MQHIILFMLIHQKITFFPNIPFQKLSKIKKLILFLLLSDVE